MQDIAVDSGYRRGPWMRRFLRIRGVEDKIKAHLERVNNAEKEFQVCLVNVCPDDC